MRAFAIAAALASAVAAECWETENEYGSTDRQCDGQWVECHNDCWYNDYEEREICENWCWENDSPLEEAMDDISDAVEDVVRTINNPERLAEEIEDLFEDIECWWAGRAPETSCAKWERWAAQEACESQNDGSRWNWDEQWCMDRDQANEFEMNRCYEDMARGMDEWGCGATGWQVNEWYDETDPWSSQGWCSWECMDDMKNVMKKDFKMSAGLSNYLVHTAKNDPVKMHAVRVLQSEAINIHVDLDLSELEQIGMENEQIQREAAEVLGAFGQDVGALMEMWGPVLEQLEMEQQRREEELAMRLADLIGGSVKINDAWLSDIVGDPSQWLMARRVQGAKDVKSLFALNKPVVLVEDIKMDEEI